MANLDILQNIYGDSQGSTHSGSVDVANSLSNIFDRDYDIAQDTKRYKAEAAKTATVGGLLKETAKETGRRFAQAGKNFVQGTLDIFKSTPGKIKEDIAAGAEDIQAGNIFEGITKAGFRTSADALNALFAPLSAAIGSTLELTGGQQLVDNFGQVIADKSGITDISAFQRFAMTHPNAAEDFNRFLMLGMMGLDPAARQPLFAGKAKVGEAEINKAIESSQREIAKRPVPEPKTPEQTTAAERHRRFAEEQGYEPYPTPESLPTIDFGQAAKSDIPTIDVGATDVLPQAPGLRYVSGETPVAPELTKIVDNLTKKIVPEKAGKPKTAVSKSAEKLRDQAIEMGIDTQFGELPEYQVVNRAEHLQRAKEFVSTQPELAKSVALGKRKPPADILPGYIYETVKAEALALGDVSTIKQLTRSKVPTSAGQTLKSFDAGDSLDVVTIIRDLENIRKTATKVKPEVEAKLFKEAKNEIRKVNTKQNWSEFLRDLQC